MERAVKIVLFHLVPNGFLAEYVSAEGLGGRIVSRILLHAIPEKSVQFGWPIKSSHLLGLKRAPAMEDASEDFPPVPLPEPFFPPPNAAPARLVRVPFKPALSKTCGNVLGNFL